MAGQQTIQRQHSWGWPHTTGLRWKERNGSYDLKWLGFRAFQGPMMGLLFMGLCDCAGICSQNESKVCFLIQSLDTDLMTSSSSKLSHWTTHQPMERFARQSNSSMSPETSQFGMHMKTNSCKGLSDMIWDNCLVIWHTQVPCTCCQPWNYQCDSTYHKNCSCGNNNSYLGI